MKKKIKIFSTIASLCLAVALMAFGVYAATNVKLSTTSTISFAATEIQGYWSLKVEGGDYAGEYATLKQVAGTVADADDNRVEVADTVEIGTINLTVDASGKATVKYTVEFTLTGERAADITVTPTLAAKTGFSVDNATAQTGEVSSTSTTWSVTFTVTLDTTVAGFDSASSTSTTFDLVCNAIPA